MTTKTSSHYSPFHTQTLLQENIFFNSPNSELASNLAALLLRLYNHNSRQLHPLPQIQGYYIQCCQPHRRAGLLEHELEPKLGQACVTEPWRLACIARPNKVLERLEELGLDDEQLGCWLVCLGGFKNARNVDRWEGSALEVDETVYEFGTSYKLECESEKPEEAKRKIVELLKNNGNYWIKYSYSRRQQICYH